ncbi:MAG: hypothetical protein IJU64_02685 [Bacilli bacterium]|nr:hypothetical protein [Bacilli bacterium]
MKKAFWGIYSLVTVFCLAYGFPMAIVNVGKDINTAVLHFIIGGVGVVLLLIAASVLHFQKKKKQNESKRDR